MADGRERYMLRTIGACLIQFVGETGKAPTAQELFDLAWPQYERNVDFSRPGRRADEFAAKCAYTVSRFHAGKIRGCETIEKTAELYRQRQQARAGQEEQARHAEAAASPVDPVDLWGKFDPPTLPRGLLPQVIEDVRVRPRHDDGLRHGRHRGRRTGGLCRGDPGGHQASAEEARHGMAGSARMWVALVGDPSTMKTPMMSAAAKPLRRIDNEMARDNQEAMDEWLGYRRRKQKKTPQPKQPRAMMMDTTIEAAQEILKDSPNGVLLDQDELSGWFGSMDKYSGARGAQKDRAFWLQAYNGGSYTVSRVTRGNVFIPQPVGVDPGRHPARADPQACRWRRRRRAAAAVHSDHAAPGRGWPGRGAGPGGVRLQRPDQRSARPQAAEDAGILRTATPLTFDDGALKIREELERKHLDLMKLEGLNRKLTSHFGKYNGIFARLCVVWHCVEHVNDDELPAVVTEDTARRVAGFLHGFLLPHAMAFYAGVLGLANDHDRLANVADYILAHKLERITNRDVQRGDGSMRNLKRRETEAIFEQLDAFGWVTRTPGPRPSDPPHWIVNPAVHQKFAERAEAAKKRREQEREAIEDLLKGAMA